MNLILLFKKDFIEKDLVRLRERRQEHVEKILRASVGDKLCVGLVNGKVGVGKITLLDRMNLEMEVKLTALPPEPLCVNLILALPRPIVLKRILLAVSSMGVKKIVLLHSKRVEKSFWNSPVLEKQKLEEQLILGLEQAKDTMMPEVLLRDRFKPFVQDELPDIIKTTRPLVAHPEGTENFLKDIQGPVTLMIGPEGGFIPYEIEQLEGCGFKSVRLGQRILRVETAVPVLLSKLF